MDKLVFTAHMIPHNARSKVNIQTTQSWWFKSWGIWPTVFIIMLEIWVRHICRHISRMHIATLFMVCYYSLTLLINYAFKSTHATTVSHDFSLECNRWQHNIRPGRDWGFWEKTWNFGRNNGTQHCPLLACKTLEVPFIWCSIMRFAVEKLTFTSTAKSYVVVRKTE